MQLPNQRVPVARCLTLAKYTSRMLSKFPNHAALADASQRMIDGAAALSAAENLLDTKLDEILVLRVDVGFEDYASDRRVRRTFKLTEMEDGHRNGRIASQVFPDGLTSIISRQGNKQVEYMKDLESRLQAAADIWPGAVSEAAAVAEHRARYQAALDARAAKERDIRDARAARDASKERFIGLYAEIASVVKAEFPRNRMMSDLFFDRVRARQSAPAMQDDCSGDGTDTTDDDGTTSPLPEPASM